MGEIADHYIRKMQSGRNYSSCNKRKENKMQAPKQKQRELIPADSHLAICYAVVDLCTQEVEYVVGQPQKTRQIMIQWELPDCRMEGESDGEKWNKPRVTGKTYTFSTYVKSNLAQHITPWMGGCPDDFKFESLIGQPCLLSIVHRPSKQGNVYANVAGVMKVPNGMTTPQQENPSMYYSYEEMAKEFPEAMMGDNYKWLREKIEGSVEFKMIEHAAEVMGGDEPLEDTTDYVDDENLPF